MSKVETQNGDAKKTEGATSESKKLALKCKTLEMQLRQSVPKKEHHEVTSKLEKQIDSLEKDLDRARDESQKTVALNKQISGVESLISSLTKTMTAQGKRLDSIDEEGSARGKVLAVHGKALDAIAAKLSQGTVPSQVYLQSISKIERLEEDKRNMVRRFDYNTLESRCEELSRQIGTMVPSGDYAALKQRLDEATKQMTEMVPATDYAALKQRTEELEGAMYTMVPREKFVSTQQRVDELEARLSEHVPQSTYDELVAKVMSLAEAVSGGEFQTEEAREDSQPERAEAEATPEATPEVTPEAVPEAVPEAAVEAPAPAPEVKEEVIEAPAPAPAAPAAPEPQVEVAVAAPAPQIEAQVPEVREVQSQLAELGAKAQEAQDSVPEVSGTPQAEPPAFTFSGTDIAVKTGTEFAQAIGKLPSSIIETHVRSGDFEKWFAGSLSDESTADSLRKVREGGAAGEELRSQVASSVSKYAPAAEEAASEVAPAIAASPAEGSQTS